MLGYEPTLAILWSYVVRSIVLWGEHSASWKHLMETYRFQNGASIALHALTYAKVGNLTQIYKNEEKIALIKMQIYKN